jgi:uncharacterized protein (DUF1501 family)
VISRRHFLGATGSLSAASLLGGVSIPGQAAGEGYRALVVVYLNGGNDGNNVLVPTDGAYGDYQTSRANLALPRNSLATLSGSAAGHTFGLHSSLTPLVALYNSGRLGFISNVGPLVEPATGRQVLDNAVRLPPFLMSHSDQTAIVQGWNLAEDNSGWAGRGLETLPISLRHPLSAVTMDTNRTLVLGKQSTVTFMPPGGTRWWGTADLAYPETPSAQSLTRMARWQSANAYEAEYARTLGSALYDSAQLTQAFLGAKAPTADFGNDWLGNNMRALSSVLPYFKAQGLKRQVFLNHWGGFDTHANQRGADMNTQDAQLVILARVLEAFDATNRANGMDMSVVTLVMTEFGRTLRPGSGGGSEHAWGNHWWLMGGPVAGGTVHGVFPSMVLGGPDDGDPGKNGRHVPSTSSDQVGASLMQWLGMESSYLLDVFPNLANFKQKTLPLIRI